MAARVARSESKKKKRRASSFRKVLVAIIIAVFILAVCFAMSDGNPFEDIQLPEFGQTTPNPTADPSPTEQPADQIPALNIYTIDVGQGDCSLLISPNGKTMLIDSGESTALYAVRSILKTLKVKQLDIVVASHPHSDHIGGMTGILRSFNVGKFYMPNVSNPSSDYRDMISALNSSSAEVNYISADNTPTIEWDEDITIEVLSPFNDITYQSINDYSAIMRVSYGDTSMLFTGDVEGDGVYSAEYTALARNTADKFRSTVIKVPHHGSLSSLSDAFLSAVSPKYAVISVGEGNDYAHPHQSTLNKLKNSNVEVFRTDLLGTIHISLDGENASITPFEMPKSGGLFK